MPLYEARVEREERRYSQHIVKPDCASPRGHMKAERGGRLPRSVLRYPSELLRISGDILSTRFAPQRVERVFHVSRMSAFHPKQT